MHIYLYDTFVGQKKFDSVLARIETRTTDLGLNGKIVRMGVMNSVAETVANEIKKGAKTITAVGNNALVNKAINAIAGLSAKNVLAKNVPLGIIPVGKKDNTIAEYLGIPSEEAACDILSARRIEKLDLGKANDLYFLTYATITSLGTTIDIDQNYSIEIKGTGDISVVNLPTDIKMPPGSKSNALDGVLELCIKTSGARKFLPISPQQNSASIFSFNKLSIINKNHPLIIDNSISVKTPVVLSLAKEKINVIVGKNRNF